MSRLLEAWDRETLQRTLAAAPHWIFQPQVRESWETSEPGVAENKNPLVEVHRLAYLKIKMRATQNLGGSGIPAPHRLSSPHSLDLERISLNINAFHP